jgi:hypothetical protein
MSAFFPRPSKFRLEPEYGRWFAGVYINMLFAAVLFFFFFFYYTPFHALFEKELLNSHGPLYWKSALRETCLVFCSVLRISAKGRLRVCLNHNYRSLGPMCFERTWKLTIWVVGCLYKYILRRTDTYPHTSTLFVQKLQ